MKKIQLLLCLGVLSIGRVSAQQPVEYTVRLNHLLLDPMAINDASILKGTMSDFLNAQGKELAAKMSGDLDFSQLQVKKLFPHYRTDDTLSISRQGNRVYVPPFWATFRVSVPESVTKTQFIRTFKEAAPLVIYIDPPLRAISFNYPTDSLYIEQKSLHDVSNYEGGINVESAWEIETGKRHIKVGVFDSGIDSTHEDIRLLTGFNYFEDVMYDGSTNWGSADVVGHGTAVAGIIGARRNNVTGIAGIAGGYGGDGAGDTSGVSILDFKSIPWTYEGYSHADFISIGIIDAARSAGTYYNWEPSGSWMAEDVSDYFKEHVPGYGVHINNHSYGLALAEPPGDGGQRDLPGGDSITWEPTVYLPDCHLCMEAYLFSLRNGVVNVIARGNGFNFAEQYEPAIDNIPQRLDDSWVISVGASGTDGERLYSPSGNVEAGENWYSPLGLNLDLIAPGTKANVATLRSPSKLPLHENRYISFNGTSASAPHVSGVVALMLSYYNKPCYSNQNLDPADVEYILQKSAMDLDQVGYDDYSGWGRLDARKALEMIQYPEYQIVHPQSPPTDIELLEQDTIHLFVDDPLYAQAGGPMSQGFFSEFLERTYKVERLKYRLTYNFEEYLQPPLSPETTELLDVWLRHSQTTSLGYHADTVTTNGSITFMDTFRIEPQAEIISWDAGSGDIVLEGYYYHFLGYYFPNMYSGVYEEGDFWFPINPQFLPPRMAYSIYLHDVEASGIEFPCDSLNILVDLYAGKENLELDESVYLFPNPGDTELFLSWENSSFTKVELYDALGQLHSSIVVNNQKNARIVTDALQSGIYFVVLQGENNSVRTKKWIKL